jgi:hypothetical protein
VQHVASLMAVVRAIGTRLAIMPLLFHSVQLTRATSAYKHLLRSAVRSRRVVKPKLSDVV